jgi:magnesium transporter
MTLGAWPEVQSCSVGPGDLLWVDLEQPQEAERDILREHFRFHPFAIDDAFADRRRPKVNDFEKYLFMVFQGVCPSPTGEVAAFGTTKLAVFLGPGCLVTIRSQPSVSIRETKDAVSHNPSLMSHGPAFLLHEILDHMTDLYIPLMDTLDGEITRLEEQVFTDPSPDHTRAVLKLRRVLARLHHTAVYQRETVHRLQRGEFSLIQDEALVYFRDVYDHLVRISDLVESHREHVVAVMEAHLSATSNRMNETMKVLTVIATIILPMTFIAGVYGMNFRAMPELRWPWGYAFAWGVMLVVGGGMYLFLRRRRWI